MASYNPIDKKIAEICKHHQKNLKQFMLANVKEVTTTNSEDEKGASMGSRMGAYGKVVEMDCDGIPCVGKVLHSIFFDFGTDPSGMKCTLEKFFKEIETLSKMKHSNIVRFMGITNNQDSPLPVLVMEKLECNLTEFLSSHEKGSITEDIALNILLGVAKGLLYLHDIMKVAHRDLSSNNVLLAADLSAKIADLGSARVLERPGGWNPSTKLSVQPGTVDFMPPEALEDSPKYTASVDVFSFGCVIIHLDTHIWPSPAILRKGENISEIERRSKYISEMVSPYLISMAQKCLQESATERPSSTVLVELLEEEVQKKKPDYTIVFAGITGAGKSAAGNFFLNKKAFQHKKRLIRVTVKSSAAISTICGKTVKIIDTPGFFDGFTPTEDNHKEISRALTPARDGIHAFAFVMDHSRYNELCHKGIQQLLRFEGIEPFLFVLLTHADDEGVTKVEADEYIQETLSDPDCPLGLKDLMHRAKRRVIMVESLNKKEDYHAQKCEEFMTMVKDILRNNHYEVYTNSILRETAIVYEQVRLQHVQPPEMLNQKQLAEESDNRNESYFEKLTEEIMAERLSTNSSNENNLLDFLKGYVKKGCFIGTILGLGTKFGGRLGGNFGYEVGKSISSFEKHHCKVQ